MTIPPAPLTLDDAAPPFLAGRTGVMPAKVLVSACLLGQRVRYNGSAKSLTHVLLDRWIEEGRVVPVCPEVMAGLPTPRPPAEIRQGDSAAMVLRGEGRIVEADGSDVTGVYLSGAETALREAVRHGCRYALLTDGSPSCGSSFVHDGTFADMHLAGEGVAASLLRQHGIEIFSPRDISMLARAMDRG